MRVKGRVQMSTYRMRSRELQLADEFLKHVQSLPVEYEKGIYFAFLEDYGTHYTKNGKSGGEYDLVYVLNQDTIKTKRMCTRNGSLCGYMLPENLYFLYVSCRNYRANPSTVHQSRHYSRFWGPRGRCFRSRKT